MAEPASIDIDGFRTFVTKRGKNALIYFSAFEKHWLVWSNGVQIGVFKEYVPALQMFRILEG